ncbi:MAG: GNAT family N-acetyltransferase [Candidatus Korobacteraceae bacterium]
MQGITIRQATIADADGILQCLWAAFEPFRNAYTDGAYEDTVLTLDSLSRRLGEMTVLVAVDRSGKVIGTIACKASGDGEGHLRGMAVLPDCQGCGIADQLLQRAEAELIAAHCSRITLATTQPLERAMRFYERHGYRRSGRTQGFFLMRLIEYVKPLRPQHDATRSRQ